MKQQVIADPVEYLDFHMKVRERCSTLERQIRSGIYTPSICRRVLVEKSNGVCRQIVVPSINDALVLQSLSDALYDDIRGKEPTDKAFFEPDDHAFSRPKGVPFARPEYGSFKAWLDFQREVFKFTRTRKYVVVTDIANYYDGISYVHLRNILSSTIHVRESVLDMLIYTLSGLLWQPDYMPHVEIGLPQINLDAPRILAHCFLYELDNYIVKSFGADYVRFMDDIDIGVDSLQQARNVLKCIDLVLHTRQIRLNSGKTKILTNEDAIRHFCVRENRVLDILSSQIDKLVRQKASIEGKKRKLEWLLDRWYREERFNRGNGGKILKRLLSMAYRIDVSVSNDLLAENLESRPSCRETTLRIMTRRVIDPTRQTIILNFLRSGMACDDASILHVAYCVVDAPVTDPVVGRRFAREVARSMKAKVFCVLYAKLWIASRFSGPSALLRYIVRNFELWRADPWLGRLVGGFYPIFIRTKYYADYRKAVDEALNNGASEVLQFHHDLYTTGGDYSKLSSIILASNPSRTLGLSHSKLLVVLSALGSAGLSEVQKRKLINAHKPMWRDPIYRARARAAVHPARLRSLIC